MNVPAVATVIDCTNVPSDVTFRFAFLRTDIGPCIFDWEFLVTVCSNDGKPILNQDFWNSKFETLPDTAIWKSTSCPTKAP